MKGVRWFLRNFTASAVTEHLRSQIEVTGRLPDLTKNEIELVRFIREGSTGRSSSPSVQALTSHLATNASAVQVGRARLTNG